MRRSRLSTILAASLALFFAGCAAHPGFERGHALTAAGQYREALAAYREVLADDPEDEEAARLVAQLAPWARDQAFDQAGRALGEGRYEDANRHADYVARLDPTLGAELRDHVAAVMRAALEAALVEGRHLEAYPLAVRAHRLFPHMRGLGTVFGRLRAHFRQESRDLADRGDFEGALAALDVIERNEPALAGELASERRALRERWADTLAQRARGEEEAGRLGIAAATYARAFEVAERERDGDAMRRLLRELRPLGELPLALALDGDHKRVERVRSSLETRLAALDGVVLAGADQAVVMDAKVHLAPLRCTQGSQRITREQDYVAGYRDVDNPAWLRLTSAIERVSTDLDRHDRELADAIAKRQRADDEVGRCVRREQEPAERAFDRAERRRERAEERVERQREKVRRLEEGRDRDAIDRARDELRRLERRADEARRESDEARRDLDRAHRQCDGHRDDVSRLDGVVLEAQTALREAERDRERLERERARTPATIAEPIVEIYRYPVELHQRSCGGEASLAVDRSWAGPERHDLHSARESRDESHGAHPTIDLPADPLAFPEPDGALRDGADVDASASIAQKMTEDIEDYYRRSVERAVALIEEDLDGATRLLLAIAATARSHLDAAHASQLADMLRKHHGLSSPTVLDR